jgi:hypothetical protein
LLLPRADWLIGTALAVARRESNLHAAAQPKFLRACFHSIEAEPFASYFLRNEFYIGPALKLNKKEPSTMWPLALAAVFSVGLPGTRVVALAQGEADGGSAPHRWAMTQKSPGLGFWAGVQLESGAAKIAQGPKIAPQQPDADSAPARHRLQKER